VCKCNPTGSRNEHGHPGLQSNTTPHLHATIQLDAPNKAMQFARRTSLPIEWRIVGGIVHDSFILWRPSMIRGPSLPYILHYRLGVEGGL
jgi:hypothetical protein